MGKYEKEFDETVNIEGKNERFELNLFKDFREFKTML